MFAVRLEYKNNLTLTATLYMCYGYIHKMQTHMYIACRRLGNTGAACYSPKFMESLDQISRRISILWSKKTFNSVTIDNFDFN